MFSKGSKTPPPRAAGETKTVEGPGGTPSIISADLKIVGDLTSGGDLQIDGAVEGNITSRRMTIGEGAIVRGVLVADSARIYGIVSGEIKANTVMLAKSARVDGDIAHQSISMEAGASVSGRLVRLDKPVSREAGGNAQTQGQAGTGGSPGGTANPRPGADARAPGAGPQTTGRYGA